MIQSNCFISCYVNVIDLKPISLIFELVYTRSLKVQLSWIKKSAFFVQLIRFKLKITLMIHFEAISTHLKNKNTYLAMQYFHEVNDSLQGHYKLISFDTCWVVKNFYTFRHSFKNWKICNFDLLQLSEKKMSRFALGHTSSTYT